jgi:tripartite ATP-independent transporter DctP family solute receptor
MFTRKKELIVMLGTFLILALFVAYAQAAKIVMNVGWSTPMEHNYGILANKFKELAEEYTNGTVEVKLRCCGQLGTEDGAFKSLQLGTIDAFIITANNISPHFPLIDVFVLPYIFQNAEHVVKVLDGPVGQEIFDKMLQTTKVHYLCYGPVVYRDLYNTKRPINTFEDFGGLKYRVPKNNVMIETFKAFGAEPVPLAWSETPTALQTGTIDGGDNGTDTIKSMKFYEFAKYLAVLEHFAAFSPMLASDRFMSKLNDDQKAAIKKAAREANEYTNDISLKATEEIRSFLASNGMEITRPDKTKFIEAAMKVQNKFADEKGDEFKSMLMKIREEAK